MEWYNVSYNDPQVRRSLDLLVGPPYGLWRSIRMGGTGSPRMELHVAPPAVIGAIDRLEDRRTCSLEFRPAGLLMRCRQRLETLALPLRWSGVETELAAPGAAPHGELVIHCVAGRFVLHVPRDHWGTLERLFRTSAPQGRFRTLPSPLYPV